jgi:hypothetical protein
MFGETQRAFRIRAARIAAAMVANELKTVGEYWLGEQRRKVVGDNGTVYEHDGLARPDDCALHSHVADI